MRWWLWYHGSVEVSPMLVLFFFFQAEDGIRDLVRSRGLGDVYKRQLWDFEANSRAVLAELHAEFGLAEMGVDGDAFIPAYEEVNVALWARMEAGTIPKEVIRALRFNQALEPVSYTHLTLPTSDLV